MSRDQADRSLSKSTVRIGLVGCGRLAEFGYIPAFRRASRVALAGVADVNPHRCKQIAPEVPAYSTIQELIRAGGWMRSSFRLRPAAIWPMPRPLQRRSCQYSWKSRPGLIRGRPRLSSISLQDPGLRSTGVSIRISRNSGAMCHVMKCRTFFWNSITEERRGTRSTCRTMLCWILALTSSILLGG